MSILKKTGGLLWALYGAFWFMLFAISFTIAYAFILAVKGKDYSMKLVWVNYSFISPALLKLLLVKTKVHGREKIAADKTYVFVANHTSQLDIILAASATPQPARFLAKMETKYIPFFGVMVRMLGIVVDRQSKESREQSYLHMAAALNKGESLFLYPEGTRNRTDVPLKEFKDGAFKVAIMAQVPVAVQTIVGAKALNPVQGFQLYPGTVNIYWSTPIETKGMTLDDLPALKERARQEMLAHLS